MIVVMLWFVGAPQNVQGRGLGSPIGTLLTRSINRLFAGRAIDGLSH